MKRNALEPDLDNLPRTIPIFPLNGALLLPGGRLPLNIFEPRYLSMVSDALSSPHRMIGMIQTNDASSQDEAESMLYTVGCVGKLSSFEETPDGRYLISLDGLIRFTVDQEIESIDGYRRANVTYDRFTHDLELSPPNFDRDRLLSALRTYFDLKGFTADWDAIKSCDSEKLVTTLSMICPLDNEDKQALLESLTTSSRADTLSTLLEMANSGPAMTTQDNNTNVRH
ncbi:MAG: LON peptidase substrate-binding domain-containing protein [Alphaproteobacteria bacterium]|nr:LON peptidase substrate-binding domain-containing protein [Alphaproteobacteria bacterium]